MRWPGRVGTLAREFDPANAGFGGAPKFPPSMALEFLLRNHARTGDPLSKQMLDATCVAMARGGLYDQLDDRFQGVLAVVGEQGPGSWLAGVVVVPEGGGQGKDALPHPHHHPCRVWSPWRSRSSWALEGLVDRLDDLPQRAEQMGAGRLGLTLAGRA
jgi:hypothetical protein